MYRARFWERLPRSQSGIGIVHAFGWNHERCAFTYTIENGTGNSPTNYNGLKVTFSIYPAESTAPASIITGAVCDLSGRMPCPVTVRITAPAADPVADKSYNAYLTFRDTPVNELRGTNHSPHHDYRSESVPSPVETTLDLWKACGTFRGADVTLTAVLREKDSQALVRNQWIQFFVGGVPAADPVSTDGTGIATLKVPVASLPVGDTAIKAAFYETSTYIGSAHEAKLGLNYIFQGFLPPMNADGTSVFKTGRVIPFKIRILDGKGMGGISDATPEIGVFLKSSGSAGSDSESAYQGTPDAGSFMHYTNTRDDQYVYNFDLSLLKNGIYDVRMDLHDSQACGKGWVPTQYGAVISVQKK